ncbi:rhomboid-related protein 2-like [Babylonia areolata]|uniref:rhomboid-related protein 2-like n=1 Tax=Babylonia areolata TaxID=304850 RepID=UPI003FD44C94
MLKQWTRGTNTDGRSSRNSTVFTVDEDLTELDRQVRQNLEQHFRPIFQRFVYGGERLASHDLRRLLHDNFYRDMLPPDKVYELIDLVDFNPGKAVSYAEFVRIVTGGYDTDELNVNGWHEQLTDSPKTLLNSVCRNTAPQTEVDEHLKKYRCIPPPFFMITISLAELAVFIYYTAEFTAEAINIVPAFSPLMYLPQKRHEPWRFLSYFLLHQGAVDLAFNVLLQVVVGFPLEIMFSWWRLAIVYILGVLSGSLAQSVCDRYVGLAGAAGGCYAVLFGHVVAIISNWSEVDNKKNFEKRAKHWWGRPLFRILLIFLAVSVQLALAIYRRFNPDFPAYKVGIAAHLGGLVAGVMLGRTCLKDSTKYPWQETGGWMVFFTFLIIFACCAIFNIVFHDYPDPVYTDYADF